MHKILVADEISTEGIEVLSQELDVTYQPDLTAAQLLADIGNYEALLVRSRTKVTADVIKAGKKLKAIGRAGVGVDNIDVPVATECGILVLNSPEGNTASAAEHTVALMMSLSRMIPAADLSMKAGKWERSKFTGSELFNKTLGVIGLGKVGGRVAHTAQALGMKVIVHDPLVSAEKAAKLNMVSVGLEEIWRSADYITMHVPKNRETTNLVSTGVLSRVKPGVRFINTSRGGVIDEAALAKAILDGRVAGAALDVFDAEPPVDSPLLACKDKVILTPHLGASTVEAQFNVAIDLAEQMRDYLGKGIARSPVNLPYMRPDLLKALGRYVWLAEAMGSIAGQLAEGTVSEVEIIASGDLLTKDLQPLSVAALKGVLSSHMENVSYVNAHLIARNNGIQVRVSKYEDDTQTQSQLQVIIATDKGVTPISGTIMAHDEALITTIKGQPINLTPAQYMLFTAHKDQPGIVAKVAGALGSHDVNISTMSVGRRGVREDAVMVMTLDDPIPAPLIAEMAHIEGIYMARFVSLAAISAPMNPR
ncbi:MAG: phosphoglycerate dehydrogenase [Candidatus Obscuribacterales bacterium]|nr:phosphoglycerate dehydrogenase [Candidatus Obscuribacterales bacterium]